MSRVILDGGEGLPTYVVVGERVVDVCAEPVEARVGDKRLDCAWDEHVTVRPGNINAHTHVYSGLAPLGMPAPQPPPRAFLQILERVWWRLDRALDRETLRAAARLYLAEALLSGTTAILDHHESPELIEGSLDILADAAEELGMRLVTCYGATERNGGPEEARRGLDECARFVRERRSRIVRGMVGLHASFTVSDATIRRAGELAHELEVPVHVHVAEDAADVADARERGYEGPLERLFALGCAPPGSIFAHGVHLQEQQVRHADEAGVWLVHNPRSNEGNRVGYARFLAASARVALGTDGYPADMRAERAALARIGGEHGDPCAADPWLIEQRAAGGFRLMGERFAGRFGSPVGPGSFADLVVSSGDGPPHHVLVAGRVVVDEGILIGANIAAIHAEAAAQAPRLWQAMGAP